jgi:Zn-dependent protease with chaperone function
MKSIVAMCAAVIVALLSAGPCPAQPVGGLFVRLYENRCDRWAARHNAGGGCQGNTAGNGCN